LTAQFEQLRNSGQLKGEVAEVGGISAMLLELVTPLMIATAPIAIDVPKGAYDHAAQVSKYEGGHKIATTMFGTQTYNFSGRPYDNDND
jgi:hypothetical protein